MQTDALLAELRGYVEAISGGDGRASHVYRHAWQPGDFIMLDNLACAHLASPETQLPREEAGLRVLHRVVVAGGDAPLAPLDGVA
jgi:alpha-ketoglutarate-dependent taurine dioxygenase